MTTVVQTQFIKFELFRQLHRQNAAFVLPNVWDAGSARLLDSLGAAALGTTSAGLAFALGKRDSWGALSRDEVLTNARAIAAATPLPVTADLEDGFGAEPEACAETIRLAAETGVVGGSIEDATGDPARPLHEFGLAVDRVRAAAEAAHGLPFLLTARADNFICGNPDLADTIRRLQTFADAGAHVLYAPGLPDLAAIRTVCRSVDRPVNVVMGLSGPQYSVAELSDAGVLRISLGGSLARAAFGAIRRAATEVLGAGTFSYAEAAIPDAELAVLMSQEKLPAV